MSLPDFRHVLGHFPTGVVAITATEPDGSPTGMTIGSFTSVSLDPPLVAFLPSKTSSTFPKIRDAGAFCVNVLSADQEDICRRFASHGAAKFDGTSWRPGPSGSPIIDGVVAWIDCRIETIHDAGDHYIVIGRVDDLATSAGDFPLLFFQGGYGKFTSPWLVMPPVAGMETVLAQVDFARNDMIDLADALNVECLASAAVDDELHIIASAGKPGRRLVGSVGQRVPFLPPVGMAIAAWEDERRAWSWIEHVTSASDQETAGALRDKLDLVRSRGWSLALASPAQMVLETAVSRMDARNPTDEDRLRVDAAVRQLVGGDGYEPSDLDDAAIYQVRHISAPVFAPNGEVAFALNLYGMPHDLTGIELARYSRSLRRGAEAISEKLADASRVATVTS